MFNQWDCVCSQGTPRFPHSHGLYNLRTIPKGMEEAQDGFSLLALELKKDWGIDEIDEAARHVN